MLTDIQTGTDNLVIPQGSEKLINVMYLHVNSASFVSENS